MIVSGEVIDLVNSDILFEADHQRRHTKGQYWAAGEHHADNRLGILAEVLNYNAVETGLKLTIKLGLDQHQQAGEQQSE